MKVTTQSKSPCLKRPTIYTYTFYPTQPIPLGYSPELSIAPCSEFLPYVCVTKTKSYKQRFFKCLISHGYKANDIRPLFQLKTSFLHLVHNFLPKLILLLEPIHILPSAKSNSLLCQLLDLSLHHTLLESSCKSHAPDLNSERHCQCLPLSPSNFQLSFLPPQL